MVRAILIAGAMIMASAAMADEPWEVAEELDLVPTPQQISLDGESVDLTDWKIVVARDNEMAEVGADEINSRIEQLGGEALATGAAVPQDGGAIVIGPCTDASVALLVDELGIEISADDPGPQGYVIETAVRGAQPVIICAGSDELGALYAAVTLRHMIQQRNGGIVALSGSVRDWPDYLWRCNGRANFRDIRSAWNTENPEALENKVAALKRQVDTFLRMKVNHLHGRLANLAGDETLRAAQEEVITYAAVRGVHLHDVSGTNLNSVLTDEQKQQAFEPRKNRFYWWSALDVHRERARSLAEGFAETKTALTALHPVDSGAYVDPERWSQRPESDRERYGDDRAEASIEQFKLYFEIFREIAPDTMIEAVSYPYHYQFTLPDFPEKFEEMNVFPYRNWWRAIEDEEHAREVRQRLMDYHCRVAEALADDVFITFREASREVFLGCADLYPGHPIDIWTYPETYDGWHGTFFPQARYAKSFIREDHDDYFFMASGASRGRDPEACYMAHAEYLWNSDVPDGAADFTVKSRLYDVGGHVTDYQRESLAPRIARRLYGEAAEALAEVLAANISYNYVAMPGNVMSPRGEDDDDTYRHMADQAENMERLFADLEALMDRVDEGEIAGPTADDIRDDEAYKWVLFYYKYTGIGAAKARLEAATAEVRSLAEAGERQQAVEIARAALDSLDEMAQQVVGIHQRVDEAGVSVPSAGDGCKKLDSFAPADFAEPLNAIVDNAGEQD